MYIKKQKSNRTNLLTPLKAIRVYCLECYCGHPKEVRCCDSHDCSLYKYRFGKNPNRKGIGNSNATGLKRTISKSNAEVNNAERI